LAEVKRSVEDYPMNLLLKRHPKVFGVCPDPLNAYINLPGNILVSRRRRGETENICVIIMIQEFPVKNKKIRIITKNKG
jgi:hypothetical protein